MNYFDLCRILQTSARAIAVLLAPLTIGVSVNLPVFAQTPSAQSAQTAAPAEQLNLDSTGVVKEMSKGTFSSDVKPDTLSTTHDQFEQSMLIAENRKKVTGMVEAGAGAGNIPSQHGFKGENITCGNTAATINDAVNPNTQVSVAAQINTCNSK